MVTEFVFPPIDNVVRRDRDWKDLWYLFNMPYTVFIHKPDPAVEYYEAYKNIGRKYTLISEYDLASTVLQAANDLNEPGSRFLGPGTFKIKTPVEINKGVPWLGSGISPVTGTLLKQDAELDCILHVKDCALATLMSMALRGDKATYNAGTGIKIETTTYEEDLFHRLIDLDIRYFTYDALELMGDSREVQVFHAVARNNKRYGFKCSAGHTRLYNCIAGTNEADGFLVENSYGSFYACSSWDNGKAGFKLRWSVHGTKLDVQAYDNDEAGLLIEEDPPGEPPYDNVIKILATGNAKNIHVKGGKNNKIVGRASDIEEATSSYGVFVEGGIGNVIDVHSQGNKLGDYSILAGSGFLKGKVGLRNSGVQTGTGSPQTIPHLCKLTPTIGQVILTSLDDGANPFQTAVPDDTNIYVQAVSGKQYRWEVKIDSFSL